MAELMLSLRLVLGGIFAVSSVLKVRSPSTFINGVKEYQIIPQALIPAFALLSIFAEIFISLSLLSQRLVVIGALTASGLLTVYSLAIVINLQRRSQINCHCFDGLANSELTWTTLCRALLLAVWAGFLALIGSDRMIAHFDTMEVALYMVLELIMLAALEAVQRAVSISNSVKKLYLHGRR